MAGAAAPCNAAASSYGAALPWPAAGTALASTAAAVGAVDLIPAAANQKRCFASYPPPY